MSSWKECKLGDVISSISETYKFTNEKVVFLNTSDVYLGKILNKNEFNPKDLPGQAKKRIKKNDLLFSEIRPANGRYAFVVDDAENYVVSTKLMVLRSSENILPSFLNIFLTSKDMLEYLQMLAEDRSGTFPQITFDNISNIDISLPPLEEQKAIAEVLSSFDDKIDLLHRQNKTLESLAQTLFRQWFIEEAKEEWEEKTLGNIAVVQNGYAFSSKDYVEFESGHLEVFKMGHIEPGGGLRFSPKADFVPREKRLEKWTLSEDDIVMAMTDMKDNMGILGHPAMIDKSNKYVLNQRVARIYLENQDNLLNNYLLYLQLSSQEAIESLQSLANGGVQVNLSTEAIKSVSVIVPPKEFQIEKIDVFNEYLQKMKNNRKQIQTLENLRDTLLPKLLSGRIKIDYEE